LHQIQISRMAIFQFHYKDTTIIEKVFLLVFQNQVPLFTLVEHYVADLLHILLILSQELFQPRSYGLFRSHSFILRIESSTKKGVSIKNSESTSAHW